MKFGNRKSMGPPIHVVDLILAILTTGIACFIAESSKREFPPLFLLIQSSVIVIVVMLTRVLCRLYHQLWKYGGTEQYIRLVNADALSIILLLTLRFAAEHSSAIPLFSYQTISMTMLILCVLTIQFRLFVNYAGTDSENTTSDGSHFHFLLRTLRLDQIDTHQANADARIPIAILGAGPVGAQLAEDIIDAERSPYQLKCFIDTDPDKIGREISGVKVLAHNNATIDLLRRINVQTVIMSIPNMEHSVRVQFYEDYRNAGFRVKVYDYRTRDILGKKRQVREIKIEDLLMRSVRSLVNERTQEYYRGKTIIVTGGGGSIGSEIARQIARLDPAMLIIADVYENCAYELQQELRSEYGMSLDLKIEIVNVMNHDALSRVFEAYHPDICIHAAAHKHVPLMEHNCIEAVENNVFGTLNVVRCCEEFGCGRFMMVSTDKAVNPTNVMGATKRVCEMIMQAHSTVGLVRCTATRFGNVLGSAGSVIPLFERQIASGGPVTVTDRRIIRYFMTIPEASQLVLTSGAMAENGELFVLDMGKPVRIYDLAQKMIRLSGAVGVEIVETGLRPGEKLYEELLVRMDTLERTDHDLIFIEKERPLTMEELEQKIAVLKEACATGSDAEVRNALKRVVPTFRSPEEVNSRV